MTDYNQIAGSEIDVDSPLTASIFERLRDNPIAIASGTNGAPQLDYGSIATSAITSNKIAANAVTESKLDASNIKQTHLDTSINTLSATGGTVTTITLPGGSYGFFIDRKASAAGSWNVKFNHAEQSCSTNYRTQVTALQSVTLGTPSSTLYIRQRYINSSPPYNIGNGDIAFFIYAQIDNNTNEIKTTYAADAPPWAYNGPTDIRPDFYDIQRKPWRFKKTFENAEQLTGDFEQDQIKLQDSITKRRLMKQAREGVVDWSTLTNYIEPVTHDIKNADMPLIPQPFSEIENTTTILINPTSALVDDLALLAEEEQSISELLHNGYLTIDNDAVDVAAPPGVKIVNASWKKTSR